MGEEAKQMRRIEIDVARGLAMIGIVANHTLSQSHIEVVTLLQDIPALLFVFLSGVSARITQPSPKKTYVRAGVFALLGVILALGVSNVAVILVNFAFIIAVTPLLPRLFADLAKWRALAWITVGIVLSSLLQHILRGLVDEAPLGFTVLAFPHAPIDVLISPLVGTMYPAIVWAWAYVFGWWTEHYRILPALKSRPHGVGNAALCALGVAIVMKIGRAPWEGFDLGLTDPIRGSWVSPAPYSSGFPDVIGGLAVCFLVYLMCETYRQHLEKVAYLGRNTLSLYSLHLAIHAFVSVTVVPQTSWAVAYFGATVLVLAGLNTLTSGKLPLEKAISQLSR